MVDARPGGKAYCLTWQIGGCRVLGGHPHGGEFKSQATAVCQRICIPCRKITPKSRDLTAAAIFARADARGQHRSRPPAKPTGIPEFAPAVDEDWRSRRSDPCHAGDQKYQLIGNLFSGTAGYRAGNRHRVGGFAHRAAARKRQRPAENCCSCCAHRGLRSSRLEWLRGFVRRHRFSA